MFLVVASCMTLLPAAGESGAEALCSAVGGGDTTACEAAMPGARPGTLRVVTYNVRRFKGQDGESTVAAIADALADLSPSVVALNEVDISQRPEALTSMARRLGNFSVAFFGHVRGRYGNALLSRFPIVAKRETHLRGGTEFSFPAGTVKFNGEVAKEGETHRIARGLLECDIELPEPEGQWPRVLTVAVTHLDHISEEQRQVQVQHIVEAVQAQRQAGGRGALLVGDMNALTRSDYVDEEWSALEQNAIEHKWAPPEPARCLETLAEAGFEDAFAASRGGGPLCELPRHEADLIFTAHVDRPMYRIDYCFLAGSSGLEVAGARVHSEVKLSDHFPVAFDLIAEAPAEARL